MKKILLSVSLACFAIISTLSVSGQKADFAGTWKIDKTKSQLTENPLVLTKITIKIKGDSLFTVRVYDIGDGQEYPFNENVILNGTESKITIYDMPRKARATWSDTDNSVKLESTTTFYGSSGSEDFVSKESWKVDKATNTLTISFNNKSTAGEAGGRFLYSRQ